MGACHPIEEPFGEHKVAAFAASERLPERKEDGNDGKQDTQRK
jgi:hypothetical protein